MSRPAENVESLPKWAKFRIQKLEADIETFRSRLAAGPEESDTFADAFSEAKRPLGKGTLIEFVVEDVPVRVRIDGDHLDVNGGDQMQIVPQASNAIRVYPRRIP